jgi:recombination protein RecR
MAEEIVLSSIYSKLLPTGSPTASLEISTALYLEKILKDKDVEISRLAVGLPVGSNLEYIDDKTISSAISGRVKLS